MLLSAPYSSTKFEVAMSNGLGGDIYVYAFWGSHKT